MGFAEDMERNTARARDENKRNLNNFTNDRMRRQKIDSIYVEYLDEENITSFEEMETLRKFCRHLKTLV